MERMKRSYQFSNAFRRRRRKQLLVSGSLNPVYDTADVDSPCQGSGTFSGLGSGSENGSSSQSLPDLENLNDKELHIQVMRARNLLAMDINGYSDPYCLVKIGYSLHRTSIVKKSLKPSWNEMFIVYPSELKLTSGTVKFEVWDADEWTRDDFIGQVKFNFFDFPNATPENKKKVTLKLLGPTSFLKEIGLSHAEKGLSSRGTLTFSFWWSQAAETIDAGAVNKDTKKGGRSSSDNRCVSSLCRLPGQPATVPSVLTTRMGSLYEEPATVYICLRLCKVQVEISTEAQDTDATPTKASSKSTTVGKIFEKAKGCAKSMLPSIGTSSMGILAGMKPESNLVAEETGAVPGSAFLDDWVDDMEGPRAYSPFSEMICSDEDDPGNKHIMESIPESEIGADQTSEEVLQENRYWQYKMNFMKQCHNSKAVQNEQQGQVHLEFREKTMFVALKPLADKNIVISLYNSPSPKSRRKRNLVLKWKVALFELIDNKQANWATNTTSGVRGTLSIWCTIIDPDMRSCLYHLPLRRHTTALIDLPLDSAKNEAQLQHPAEEDALSHSMTLSRDLNVATLAANESMPKESVGEFSIEIEALELQDPVDCFCVAKCGPHWCKTTIASAARECCWAWEIHLPIYDPSTFLIFAVFQEHRRQFEMKGKLHLRLSSLEPNRQYRTRLPIACDGSVTGHVTLCMKADYPSWSLLAASYFAPPMPKHTYECGIDMSRFQKIIKRESTNLLIGWLDKNASRIPAPVSQKVISLACDSFSISRLRTHVQRINLSFSHLKPAFTWMRYIQDWENPPATFAVALGLCAAVFNPSKAIYLVLLALGMLCTATFKKVVTVPTMADAPLIPDTTIEEAPKLRETQNPYAVLKASYEKMQSILMRVQNGMDAVASGLEKVEALVTWRDPVASRIFSAVLFIAAIAVQLFGIQFLICCGIVWLLRPPRMRDSIPPPPVNLFRRIPARGDQVL